MTTFLKAMGASSSYNYTATAAQRLVISWSSQSGGNVSVTLDGSTADMGRGLGSGEINIFLSTSQAVTIATGSGSGAVVSVLDL